MKSKVVDWAVRVQLPRAPRAPRVYRLTQGGTHHLMALGRLSLDRNHAVYLSRENARRVWRECPINRGESMHALSLEEVTKQERRTRPVASEDVIVALLESLRTLRTVRSILNYTELIAQHERSAAFYRKEKARLEEVLNERT